MIEAFRHNHQHGHSRETVAILEALEHLSRQSHEIMSQLTDLIAAGSSLSTAADGLSVKADAIVAAAEAVVVALQNAPLPPEGEAALAKLQATTAATVAAGDRVDAEVAKLDKILPTPAPAAPAI